MKYGYVDTKSSVVVCLLKKIERFAIWVPSSAKIYFRVLLVSKWD
jgi:hypothetical protein